MNFSFFTGKANRCIKTFCLAGLIACPVLTVKASDISLHEVNGIYSLSADKATVKQVFDYIELNSKYVFVYDQQVKNILSEKVTFETKGKTIEDILADVCSQVGLNYQINNRQVSITAGARTASKQAQPKKNTPKSISGTVKDGNGEPLIGATVRVKGSSTGTVTDIDGNYTLNVPANAELEISYIGFIDQQIHVGNKTNYNIILKENANNLDEVVVIGYGAVKKKDLTGAVAAVKGEELVNKRTTMLSNALQGTLSGVTVSRSSSAPGSGASSIRVRGITTIGESSPLVIVDGVEGSLDYVNANDVESISVLKDAAAASIYGSKAAAGVILVTTKRGNDTGKLDLKYNAEFGWEIPTKQPSMVGVTRYPREVSFKYTLPTKPKTG